MKKVKPLNKIYQRPLMVLASGSASRRRQLQSLGFDFKVEISGIDEDIYKISPKAELKMGQVAQKIAQAKVEKVAKKYPKALVLGGDQMAVLGTKIFNKPMTSKKAEESLMALQGKTHILWTALYMCYEKRYYSYLETNKMTMRKLSPAQIKAYVKKAQPLQCAGSYALERCGIGLFEKIDTSDQSAVIGFPLIALLNQLVRWQVPLPFLTSAPKKGSTP